MMNALRALSCFCFGSADPNGVLSGPSMKLGDKMEGKHLIAILHERWKSKKQLNKTAIFFSEGNTLTFNQLNTFASCLSKSIIERLGYDYKITNPDNDLIIAVCLPMSEKCIAMILGILKTGAAYLPLDPQFPETLLLEIIDAFKPVMMITDDNGKIFNKYDTEKFSASVGRLVSIEELWLDVEFAKEPRTRRASMENPWEIEFLENKDWDPALLPIAIFYSKGLAGNPVGVRVCTKSVINVLVHLWDKYLGTKNDHCCCTVSIGSPFSIPQVFIPLLQGCTLNVFRRVDVNDTDKFVKNVSWRNITSISIPTHNLIPILQSVEAMGQPKAFKHLQLVVCRGGIISPAMAKQFFSNFKGGVTLAICMGFLETTCDFTLELYTSLKDYESKLVDGKPIMGHVMANSKVYIVDENMKLVQDGKTGQICVSGACLALGYVNEPGMGDRSNFYKNPFTNSSKFCRLFMTGEYGQIMKLELGKRNLLLEGRTDTLVKMRGHIICVEEIRQHVNDLDGVSKAFVFVYNPEDAHLQQLIGFVILQSGVVVDESLQGDFDFQLRNRLPEYAIPDEIHVIKGVAVCTCNPKKKFCGRCFLQMATAVSKRKSMAGRPSKITIKKSTDLM